MVLTLLSAWFSPSSIWGTSLWHEGLHPPERVLQCQSIYLVHEPVLGLMFPEGEDVCFPIIS